MSLLIDIVAVIALVNGAWLRAAGAAVSQIPRADAHHDAADGLTGARTVAALLDDRPRIYPAVGMVGSALLVLAAALAVVGVEQRWSGWGVAGATIVVVGVGDVIPRLMGRWRPRLVAYRSAGLLATVVRLGGWAAEPAVDENGNGEEGDDEAEEDEIALITSVLRFSETIVREVMVPRLDMVTVAADDDSDTVAAASVEHGFSRFPVTVGDDIIGLLLVKDLLPGLTGGEAVAARKVMRPAVFVPEVKQIHDLLTEMRANKTHMAIVIDEFGEIAGLVTIEDILEELVGEIVDETDDDEILVEPMGDGVWKVDARLSVEELGELLGTELPDGDWDTVAGLVLGLAERVPEEDETFEIDSASLAVARMQGRRVAEVIVTSGGAGAS